MQIRFNSNFQTLFLFFVALNQWENKRSVILISPDERKLQDAPFIVFHPQDAIRCMVWTHSYDTIASNVKTNDVDMGLHVMNTEAIRSDVVKKAYLRTAQVHRVIQCII